MSARPYTRSEATEETFRHVSKFLPDHFKAGDRFASAMYHAKQIGQSTGQTKAEHRLNWKKHVLEGLK